MNVKKTLAAVALLVVAPMAMPLAALASEGAERLNHLLEQLQTYEARFEQQILDASVERRQEARGQMWLSRPGKFRWEVEAPYLQEVISDGEEVMLHDPALEQATIQQLDQRVTHTPTLLLYGGVCELTDSYSEPRHLQGAALTFTLLPRDP